MLLTADARGVYPIAPTPFFDDGRIDTESIDRLTDFYLPHRLDRHHGARPARRGAEARAMTRASQIASRMIRRAPALPVIVGVSAPGFAAMRALTHEVMSAGAAGVMIAPPNTLAHRRPDRRLLPPGGRGDRRRRAVRAAGLSADLLVQMTPAVIRRIVTELPSCAMLKHEDWPGLEKISTLRGFERDGSMRHIAILCGNGGLFLDYEMERGADGANTGYAFPDMLCDVVRLSAAGQRDAAHDLFDAHLPLLRYEQQPGLGLAVRKYVMMRRGILTSARAAQARGRADAGHARRGRPPARPPRPPRRTRASRAGLSLSRRASARAAFRLDR